MNFDRWSGGGGHIRHFHLHLHWYRSLHRGKCQHWRFSVIGTSQCFAKKFFGDIICIRVEI